MDGAAWPASCPKKHHQENGIPSKQDNVYQIRSAFVCISQGMCVLPVSSLLWEGVCVCACVCVCVCVCMCVCVCVCVCACACAQYTLVHTGVWIAIDLLHGHQRNCCENHVKETLLTIYTTSYSLTRTLQHRYQREPTLKQS